MEDYKKCNFYNEWTSHPEFKGEEPTYYEHCDLKHRAGAHDCNKESCIFMQLLKK